LEEELEEPAPVLALPPESAFPTKKLADEANGLTSVSADEDASKRNVLYIIKSVLGGVSQQYVLTPDA
jgi:hypothetical protein